MEATILLQCFSDTLSHEAAMRTDAESKLKEFSKVPGFLGACLDILSSTKVPGHLKLSAALYFKNKVTYGWSGKSLCRNELLDYTIDNDEKPVVKEMLIKALVNCSSNAPNCIRVLQPALTEIITIEYGSGKWDSLLVESFHSLNSSDIHTAHIGLLCAAEVFRTYRWKDNDDRQNLEMIIVEYFPSLLDYANQRLLMDGANLDNELIGQMVKLVLKIYKFVIYNDLPFTLQRPETFIPWANFHVSIIQQQLSSNFLNSTTKDERKKNAWVKAKKWAYANMHRLFQRYASESLSKKFSYDEFKGLYIEQFLPQLLQLLFLQIEQWGSDTLWLSEESMYYILEFIEQTVTQKATWPIVNHHYTTILQHVIFPLLCPNEETLEVFESDPQEYIHRNLESWDENYSPDLAALSLLTTSIRKRTKTTLEPTLQFVTQCLQENAVNAKDMTLEQATKTESCLRIVSSILEKLIHPKSPYSADMEGFLSAFVFPMFQSNYGFLRARVCELCSKLHGYKFSQEYNLQFIYNGVMECFNNDTNSLPVRLLAALALQTFIDVPEFNQSLKEIVVPTMQKLLQLSNEFESDTISGVMQEFVESFPEQLQPFAVELMNNLVQQFLKLAIDFHEASNFNINALSVGELPDESDKQLAALGILSTAISILLSFENSKDIAKNLEQSFYPAAEFILKNDIEDFYRDACEFVENSTFLLREVTPISWKILELIGECNERENSMAAFYLEDFMLAINNYLIYGRNELRQNSFYLRILFRIFQKASEGEDNGLDEVKVLSDLSQKIVLALGDSTPRSYLNVFLTSAVEAIKTEQHILKQQVSFGVTVFNVVVSSLLHFPLETLQFLQTCNCLQLFFEVWAGHYIPNCKRIYDIKLYLMTLLSLSSNTSINDLVSLGLEPVVSKMGGLIYNLIERYPVALMKLKDKRIAFSSDAFGSTEGFDDYEEDSYNDADGEVNEEYLEILKEEANSIKFVNGEIEDFVEDFDDLEEDPLSGSVLDDVNIYDVFQKVFNDIQQSDPMKHQTIFGSLSPEQHAHITHILNL